MTRDEIINELVEQRLEYLVICRKISRNSDLHQDLFQELVLILMEYDPEKLEKVHAGGGFRWFAIKIIRNLWKGGKYSSFGQKYRHYEHNKEIGECKSCYKDESEPDDFSAKDILEQVDKELEKMYWYEREMFKAYLRHECSAELAKVTGINPRSVRFTVQKVRQTLKKNLEW